MTRIRITDIVVVADLTTLEGLQTPIVKKFYYVEDKNTFYKKIGNHWQPVGSGVFTNDSSVKADELRNAIDIALSGDVTGQVTATKLNSNVSITTDIANSGVQAGTYGESADKSCVENSTFIIPKMTVAADGRVTNVTPITITLPANMGLTNQVVGGSVNATANAAATNGYVYLNTIKGSNVVSHHQIVGTGAVSVESDAYGNITVNASNDNTTYTAGKGIGVSPSSDSNYDYIFEHTNSVTAATASGSQGAIAYGGTIEIPSVTYDEYGHITGKSSTSVTLPAAKMSASPDSTKKAYLLGTESSAASETTAVFDTNVYLDTESGELHATKFTGALNGTADRATKDGSGNNIASTYAPLASPAMTGTPTAPTADPGTNTTQVATTAYVKDAVDTLGSSVASTYAPLASPAMTGTPTAPTAAAGTNTTQVATTAYVSDAVSTLNTNVGNTYAPKASPALTGTPTAPTASVGTNDTQIATTAFVASAIAAMGDVLEFKGTLGQHGTITALPSVYKKGQEWKVITAGTYAGNVCEVGDLIIAINTVTATDTPADSDWCVVQGNIDGAVTGGSTDSTDQIEVTKPNASTIKVNHKDSGVTAGTYGNNSTATISFGDTIKVPKAVFDAKGHATSVEDITLTLSHGTSGAMAGTYGNNSTATLDFGDTIKIPKAVVDANGHITSVEDITLTMPANPNTDENVKNTPSATTKAYLTGTTSATESTGTQVFDTGVYLSTNSGELVATTFKGALDGNASTATTAGHATTADSATTAGSANTLVTARKIDGISFDGSADITCYATCPTGASTAAKVVTVSGSNTFTKQTGAKVIVKFTEANTAASMTLNVNDTGAAPAYFNGSQIGDTGVISAGGVYEFEYDGSNYVLVGTMTSVTSDPAATSAYVAASAEMVHGFNNGLAVTIAASNWSASTTTVNGTAYYTYEYQATKVWTPYPVAILSTTVSGEVLPTAAESSDYNKINSVVANTSNNKVTFYCTSKPSGTLKVIVKGAT